MKKILIPSFIFLTFVFFSLGQLGRLSFLGQQVNVYLYEAPLVVTLALLIYVFKREPFAKNLSIVKPLAIFLTYLTFSFLVSTFFYPLAENVVALLYLLRLIAYNLYLVYLIHFFHTTPGTSKKVMIGLFWFSIITIVTSLLQYFYYPDLRNLFYLGWDPHLYRLFGVFFDPPIAGAVYGLLFIFIYLQPTFIKNQYLRYVALAIFFVFIILTYSRGTFLAFIVTLLLYLLKRKSFYIMLILIGLFVGTLLILPKQASEGLNLKRTITISTRIQDDIKGLQVWMKNPILGIGYNHIRYAKDVNQQVAIEEFTDSHSGASFHSSFIIILATGGVIGLALFIYMLYMLSRINVVSLYGVIFLTILSLSDNVLLHPFVLFLFFSLVGLSFLRRQESMMNR